MASRFSYSHFATAGTNPSSWNACRVTKPENEVSFIQSITAVSVGEKIDPTVPQARVRCDSQHWQRLQGAACGSVWLRGLL